MPIGRDLQDGMLAYYNSQASAADVNVKARVEREPFDFRTFGENQVPWTPKEFAAKHNHKFKGKTASKAASMANAMLRSGVSEGVAIATANKRAPASARKGGTKKK